MGKLPCEAKGAEIKRQRSLILGVVQVQCLTLDNQIRTVCDEAVVIDRFLLFLFVFCSLDFFTALSLKRLKNIG